MKQHIAKTLVFGFVLALVGTKAADAQSLGGFYDSCRYDYKQHATDYPQRQVEVGYSRANVGRSGCPWQIVDITLAQGRTMRFAGAWPGGGPTTAAQCNGATYSWVAARNAGGTLYWIVGSGTARGRWFSSPVLGSACMWDLGRDIQRSGRQLAVQRLPIAVARLRPERSRARRSGGFSPLTLE